MVSSASTKSKFVQEFKDVSRKGADMQALISRGYKELPAAKYLLLKIGDSKSARRFLSGLIDLVTCKDNSPESEAAGTGWKFGRALNIAFTASGLVKLELPPSVMDTFSREFQEGMTFMHDGSEVQRERSILLGDRGRNDPSNWRWGNKDHPVDVMLLLYAKDKVTLKSWEEIVLKHCDGVTDIGLEETSPAQPFEHFGFMDGISQPIVKGFSKSDDNRPPAELVNAGEFILGFTNEYDNYSPSPYVIDDPDARDLKYLHGHSDKKNLGRNGTYLVFRQIEQHVDEFWKYMVNETKEDGRTDKERAEKLAAKMVGRWRDGRPLTICPNHDDHLSPEELNKFKYEDDGAGKHCPFGAHIRRMNPRDQTHAGRDASMSLEISNKHRMLRRGRNYGELKNIDELIERLIEAKNLGEKMKENGDGGLANECKESPQVLKSERGLHFICLVSDISRQFEFVQNVWGNTPCFAALTNEVDPLISPRKTSRDKECHQFTAPQEKLRNRYKNVPEFTTVIGGQYFFMPGKDALKYILR
ncbi:Dyp-type peroxidase [Flavitalea antarctica]